MFITMFPLVHNHLKIQTIVFLFDFDMFDMTNQTLALAL